MNRWEREGEIHPDTFAHATIVSNVLNAFQERSHPADTDKPDPLAQALGPITADVLSREKRVKPLILAETLCDAAFNDPHIPLPLDEEDELLRALITTYSASRMQKVQTVIRLRYPRKLDVVLAIIDRLAHETPDGFTGRMLVNANALKDFVKSLYRTSDKKSGLNGSQLYDIVIGAVGLLNVGFALWARSHGIGTDSLSSVHLMNLGLPMGFFIMPGEWDWVMPAVGAAISLVGLLIRRSNRQQRRNVPTSRQVPLPIPGASKPMEELIPPGVEVDLTACFTKLKHGSIEHTGRRI